MVLNEQRKFGGKFASASHIGQRRLGLDFL